MKLSSKRFWMHECRKHAKEINEGRYFSEIFNNKKIVEEYRQSIQKWTK